MKLYGYKLFTRPLLAASLLLATIGLPVHAAENARYDQLTVALGADPVGVQPAMHFHAPGKLVMQHVGEALVAQRDDMSIAPMLAESFGISDDGLRYTFHLRRQARFHNGQPLTADDVVWAWKEYYLNPQTEWHCRVYYDGSGTIEERTTGGHIQSIKALDEHTVEFVLHQPSNLFLPRMADVSCAPIVLHRESFTADGEWNHLIATGPYQLESWTPGDAVRLKRFDGYVPRSEPRDGYGGAKLALAETILLPIYADRQAAIQDLKDGKLDAVLDVQESERMWLEGTPGIDIHTTGTINFWNLLIQTRDPLLSDVRMRRAIVHAIDIEYLAAVLTEGRQTANPSVVSQNSKFHSAVHDQGHAFDLAKSRQLLSEAGYDGQPVEIQTNRDEYPEMYRIAVLVRSMLQAAGINAVLNVMPWKEQLDTHYRSGSFQLQAFGQGGRNHPALVYGKFIGPKDEMARFQWDDDEAHALVAKAQTAKSEQEQQAIYDELHTRMLQAAPTLVLLNFEYHDATRSNISGFHTTPFMRTTLWGVGKH